MKDRSFDSIQKKKGKGKKTEKSKENYRIYGTFCIMGVSEGEKKEKGVKGLF